MGQESHHEIMSLKLEQQPLCINAATCKHFHIKLHIGIKHTFVNYEENNKKTKTQKRFMIPWASSANISSSIGLQLSPPSFLCHERHLLV